MESVVECVVEYDYSAEQPDELNIRVGDVITHVERLDGGWWRGRLRGEIGMFPDNFVKVLPGPPVPPPGYPAKGEDVTLRSKKRCRVLFSYNPAHDDELQLQVDDSIDFMCEVEDGWWKGRLNGRVGVFPSNFVEMCNYDCDTSGPTTSIHSGGPPASLLNSSGPYSSGSGPNNSFLNHSGPTTSQHGSGPPSSLNNSGPPSSIAEMNKKNSLAGAGHNIANGLPSSEPVNHITNGTDNQEKTNSGGNNGPADQSQPHLMTTSERVLRNTAPPPDKAPRLPPKPVKDQCLVLFPYTAQNEDELSLEEGQVITIITREVEDKGWWKGELDGRVGVFPDNFVKLLQSDTTEEVKDKKPQRPLPSTTTTDTLDQASGSLPDKAFLCAGSVDLTRSASEVGRGLSRTVATPDSVEKKLAKKMSDIFKKSSSNLLEAAKPKVAKSDPPLANKEIIVTAVKLVDSESGAKTDAPPQSEGAELDGVERVEKLDHVTASRVKAPKRRPPSSIFLKDNIPDLEELPVDSEEEPNNNQVGLRLSGGQVPEGAGEQGDSGAPKTGRPVGGMAVLPVPKGGEDAGGGGSSRPTWLEELSRKQANRRSGIFTEERKPEPPEAEQKPSLPSKPSEARKSIGNFNKRTSNLEKTATKQEKPARPSPSIGLTKAASSSGLTDSAALGQQPRTDSASSPERRKVREGQNSPAIDKIESKPEEGSARRTDTVGFKSLDSLSGSGRKHSDISRKHSDSSISRVSAESQKPASGVAAHSANLGRPEGKSFALPDRPASAATEARQQQQRRSSGSCAGSITPPMRQSEMAAGRRPETIGEQAAKSGDNGEMAIGWKPIQALQVDRTKTVSGVLTVEEEVSQLNSSMVSLQADFGLQLSALRSDVGRERERRTVIEATFTKQADRITSLEAELAREREHRTQLQAEMEKLWRLVKGKKAES